MSTYIGGYMHTRPPALQLHGVMYISTELHCNNTQNKTETHIY